MEEQEFAKLKLVMIETGQIPEKYYCEECGCVKVTIEQSFNLEELFYSMIPRGGIIRPIYVDICACDEEEQEVEEE